jgi:hypothetical protein
MTATGYSRPHPDIQIGVAMKEEPMLIVRVGCPICANGLIGIRRCSDGKSLVLMCDECESVWLDPQHISAEEAVDVQPPSFVVAQLGVSVAGVLAGWAGDAEASPWRTYVRQSGSAK